MLNLHGSLFAIRALVKPGLVVPGIKVETIARLDFVALKKAGYTGAVFDRDNCLTIPHKDTVVPDIADAWARCKSTFGPSNVLVVSNSAGTKDDPLGIQLESLSFNLGVPVLRHSKKKPACADEILTYFRRPLSSQSPASSHPVSDAPRPGDNLDRPNLNEPLDPDSITSSSLIPLALPAAPTIAPTPRLLVIGDRLLTDVLLASTLGSSHLGIWTTHLWSRPDLPLVRAFEQSLLRVVLWTRNQTFRNGVVEARARGENWLGREGWIWWVRRTVVGTVRRVLAPPEPMPPRTNELAKFVLPVPSKAILPPPLPATRMGWAWYYSKIGGRYAAKGVWIGLVWSAMQAEKGAKRGWAWMVSRIKESRAKRIESSSHAESKS